MRRTPILSVLYLRQLILQLSNGSRKNQVKEQQATATAAVTFQALISLIKLLVNVLIGHWGKKREI